MPIYEFYCCDCHRLFNFLSRTSGSSKRPACPRCRKPRLERRVSAFAISKGRPEPAGGDELPDLDESKMEHAMAAMAQEAEGLDDDDPRQMAGMMRKLFDSTGMQLGRGMEEAMRRMEAGEDPDKIEEEMGDALEQEEPFLAGGASLKSLHKRLRPPTVDDTLYEM
jgi:putative FmdB family regulatory protein